MTIGSRIKILRVARKQTLGDVRRGTRLATSFLSELENGKSNPSVETLQKLAGHFDMPIKSFFTSEWDWEPLEVSGD